MQSQQRDWSIVVRANYTITDQAVAEVTGTGSRANIDQVRLGAHYMVSTKHTHRCTHTDAPTHAYTHTLVMNQVQSFKV